jgi:hypothetical protein
LRFEEEGGASERTRVDHEPQREREGEREREREKDVFKRSE